MELNLILFLWPFLCCLSNALRCKQCIYGTTDLDDISTGVQLLFQPIASSLDSGNCSEFEGGNNSTTLCQDTGNDVGCGRFRGNLLFKQDAFRTEMRAKVTVLGCFVSRRKGCFVPDPNIQNQINATIHSAFSNQLVGTDIHVSQSMVNSPSDEICVSNASSMDIQFTKSLSHCAYVDICVWCLVLLHYILN